MVRRHQSSLKQLICRIDVTAFAAVMFALVAAFLVRASYHVDLPSNTTDAARGSHPIPMPTALREDVLEVSVTRDGRIWLGYDSIPIGQLPNALRAGVEHGSERKVYIRADRRANYSAVKQVLDAAHSADIENIAFLVDGRSSVQHGSGERLH